MNLFLHLRKTVAGAAALSLILAAGTAAAAKPVHAAQASSTYDTAAAAASVSAATKADRIVAYAESLKGKVKYSYGTNNPSKLIFDCSSFTKYVFASQGVSLKWGSAAQSKQGAKVSKANLRKGDLMFFTVGSSKSIGHVGIYMGNGKFIHNTIGSNVNGILISSFDSGYQKRFVSAARVL
ncbi:MULTISPECIES: C40 family peptidase [unclassified Paenibacillus]|uniref:C40 family peptidase n=1 Tax=unclassified Paenibacillus TaxID=185978 RepID=UPI0009556267|nr:MULTISPECIES: C40 family peptidase [unclassified Paenibacillus]ASS66106.2 C40 family peptidase [Paenibacillus sp. RUD330]SIQ12389.1 NlpC/P60 family protein [Paenibacillus sp. RU4X]SIQ34076.1 NlpC/P60 family protein [Paenibacillus sp. RU4T]